MKRLTKFILLGISISLLLFIALIIFRPFADYKNNPSIEYGFVTDSGDYDFTLQQGKTTRYYKAHVPASYNKNNPTPLVLAFHGGMGDSKGMSNDKYYNLISKSDEEGFIVVFPNGASRLRSGKLATWNAGNCCGYARDSNSDDVDFVKKLLKDIESKFNINENRIYATGMSNGGMFSYRLACEMSDTFAAIAAVSGTDNYNNCNPEKPISIFHIHSKQDSHVLFNGGCGPDCISGGGGTEFISVPKTISKWVQRNNCNDVPKRVLEKENVYCDLYSRCDGDVEVKLCVTEDGGHSWPGGEKPSRKGVATPSTAIDATEMIWDFFKKHSKK